MNAAMAAATAAMLARFEQDPTHAQRLEAMAARQAEAFPGTPGGRR